MKIIYRYALQNAKNRYWEIYKLFKINVLNKWHLSCFLITPFNVKAFTASNETNYLSKKTFNPQKY